MRLPACCAGRIVAVLDHALAGCFPGADGFYDLKIARKVKPKAGMPVVPNTCVEGLRVSRGAYRPVSIAVAVEAVGKYREAPPRLSPAAWRPAARPLLLTPHLYARKPPRLPTQDPRGGRARRTTAGPVGLGRWWSRATVRAAFGGTATQPPKFAGRTQSQRAIRSFRSLLRETRRAIR